jgi:hypothetical protein
MSACAALQCVGRGYKLLNPGQKFKIRGIIQEIMRIIVLVQLNMLAWLHHTDMYWYILVHPGSYKSFVVCVLQDSTSVEKNRLDDMA